MGKASTLSNGYVFFSWAFFIISILAAIAAVVYAPIDNVVKFLFGSVFLLVIQASITLSKTVRDKEEQKS